jgi:SPP1 family predicted phage head-tail adaptor
MRTVRAGRLRHRLTLQAPVDTSDGAGGFQRAWSTTATLWGAIEPGDAAEGVVADALTALRRHTITIRWRTGIAAGQRLAKGARLFEIIAVVDPDERRRWLELLVEERADP